MRTPSVETITLIGAVSWAGFCAWVALAASRVLSTGPVAGPNQFDLALGLIAIGVVAAIGGWLCQWCWWSLRDAPPTTGYARRAALFSGYATLFAGSFLFAMAGVVLVLVDLGDGPLQRAGALLALGFSASVAAWLAGVYAEWEGDRAAAGFQGLASDPAAG